MSSMAMLRDLLFHNLTLKVSSLILATILWLHATTLHTYEEELTIKLKVTGIADSLVVVSPLPDKARVSFRAKGDQLWWLYLRKPHIEISAEGLGPGRTEPLPLYSDHVRLPGALDVQVTNIVAPRSLTLDLDRRARKTIPVVVTTTGLPEAPFVRVSERIDVDPAHITLEGPSRFLKDIDDLDTEPLDVSGAKGLVSKKLRVTVPHRPLVRASAEAVNARIQFERLVEREPPLIVAPVPSRVLPKDWMLDPPNVKVNLMAPSSLRDSLTALDPARLNMAVAIPRVLSDSLQLDVSIHPPKWVKQCTVSPTRVLLRRVRSP